MFACHTAAGYLLPAFRGQRLHGEGGARREKGEQSARRVRPSRRRQDLDGRLRYGQGT